MERYKQIFREMILLLESTRILNKKWFGYKMAFRTKMRSFEIMYRTTLENSKEFERIAYEEMAEGKIFLPKMAEAWHRTIAYFEAYLNAFYSLLQIVAKITNCYYEKEMKVGKPFGDNFGGIITFFKRKKNAGIDPEFSAYITENLKWYETLRNNRHMITHEGTAFLGLKKGGKTIFIDYPNPKNGFDWDEQNKSNKELEDYLTQSLKDLFDFLAFYSNHFQKKLKK